MPSCDACDFNFNMEFLYGIIKLQLTQNDNSYFVLTYHTAP